MLKYLAKAAAAEVWGYLCFFAFVAAVIAAVYGMLLVAGRYTLPIVIFFAFAVAFAVSTWRRAERMKQQDRAERAE